MTDIYTVENLTHYIRDLIQNHRPLQDVWVTGEVSNMKAAASGHWYFTLKDRNAQLKCVMFRYAAQRQAIQPQEGESLRVHGKIGVYDARGEYQLYADEVQPAGGIGDLYLKYEQLKSQLQDEGLFDTERKQALPAFPRRIGVVTSPDAAAFRDVQNVLARRFPLAQIILSPTLVQGNDAPPRIVQAIDRLARHRACDVLLVVRGGGSIEDLWAFNDERVARAISACPVPIVAGVGHETDFTIVDFVADQRAPTPSAAAEVATPSLDDLRDALLRADQQLVQATRQHITTRTAHLDVARRSLRHTSPAPYVRDMQQRLDDLSERMTTIQRHQMALRHERLANRVQSLEAANPQALLKRGYAMVTRRADDVLVTQADDAPAGTRLTIRLHDSQINAQVEDET
jgi:exodeoxyribonuclease VII large subunit